MEQRTPLAFHLQQEILSFTKGRYLSAYTATSPRMAEDVEKRDLRSQAVADVFFISFARHRDAVLFECFLFKQYLKKQLKKNVYRIWATLARTRVWLRRSGDLTE